MVEMIPCYKTIYNNKLTGEDELLIRNVARLLPKAIGFIDCPLTVLSEEDYRPDTRFESPYDFERLGYYVAEEQRIVLLRNAIRRVSSELDIPETGLRAVVFAHELGHYLTHQLPLWTTRAYRTDLFLASSLEVSEGWAQLFAAWAVKNSPEHSLVFHKLLERQSAPYHIFKRYDGDAARLLPSLDHLRELSYPARLTDWSPVH